MKLNLKRGWGGVGGNTKNICEIAYGGGDIRGTHLWWGGGAGVCHIVYGSELTLKSGNDSVTDFNLKCQVYTVHFIMTGL